MSTTISLDGAWQVRAAGMDCIGESGYTRTAAATDGWLEAHVPGEIHLDLVRAGKMAEPSLGHNAVDCRWPETHSWWYRTTFTAPADLLASERQQLIFDGLDLYAQVFLNGAPIGGAANAFVPAVFDVQPFLRAGENELVVRLTAGSELAEDATQSGQWAVPTPNPSVDGAIPNPERDADGNLISRVWPPGFGHREWPGRKWLRKAQFSYGWDWVDALPNIGIWRSVRLEARSLAVIADIRLDTVVHSSQTLIELEAVVENLHPWSERAAVLTVEITPPAGGGAAISRRYELHVPPGRMPVRDTIEIHDPKLWWPNGMGDQPLYGVVARVTGGDGALCDERRFHIGLRTIEIDRSPRGEGSRFCFVINGQEVFCRGGNIGPHDIIPARITDDKYDALVAEAKNAGMNMLRINGCSIYEPPAFYEACDRYGIMVWQDFMLTCATYPDDRPAFANAVRDEAEAVVKALRHHPSIALWCGNNEATALLVDWNPDLAKPLEIGGWRLYNQILPDICRLLDRHRPYWVSSPAGGENPNGEVDGDAHWWMKFFMCPDMQRRLRHETFDECRSGFVSEYGVVGPCHIDTIREYLSPDEIRFDSPAWTVHNNVAETGTLDAALKYHYIDTESLTVPDFVLYGQMYQAMIHGGAMEALRFRKNDPELDCQGALIWSYSDCWGETGWSILDYYLRRKASYYHFKRACAPVKVVVRRRGDTLVTRVINDTLEPINVSVETGWFRLDGAQTDTAVHTISLPANSMREVSRAPVPATPDRGPREWLYASVLRVDGAAVDQSIWTGAPHRELAVAEPNVTVKPLGGGLLEIASDTYCHAVRAEDHGRALLSDNWFDLLPGVPKRVQAEPGADIAQLRFEAIGPGRPS